MLCGSCVCRPLKSDYSGPHTTNGTAACLPIRWGVFQCHGAYGVLLLSLALQWPPHVLALPLLASGFQGSWNRLPGCNTSVSFKLHANSKLLELHTGLLHVRTPCELHTGLLQGAQKPHLAKAISPGHVARFMAHGTGSPTG